MHSKNIDLAWKRLHLESVSSTNDWLQEHYAKGVNVANFVVTASHQYSGKGIGINRWQSEPNQNMILSTAIDTGLQPAKQFYISMAIALALTDLLAGYLPFKKLFVKWPNDIWFDTKKLSGMLISHIISGNQLGISIIGVGLNVNQVFFPAEIPYPISMKLISGKHYDVSKLIDEFLVFFQKRIDLLFRADGLEQLKKDYLSQLLYYKSWKIYLILNEVVEAMIVDVNTYGQLILKSRNNKEIVCNFKEIVFPR